MHPTPLTLTGADSFAVPLHPTVPTLPLAPPSGIISVRNIRLHDSCNRTLFNGDIAAILVRGAHHRLRPTLGGVTHSLPRGAREFNKHKVMLCTTVLVAGVPAIC